MILLLVSSKYMPEYSGSGYRAHNLYKRLSSKHPDIKLLVATGSETDNTCIDYIYDGIKIKRISCKPFPNIDNTFLRMLKIPINFHAEYSAAIDYFNTLHKPDLIHIFGKNYVTAAALNYARINNIPAIIELCNEMDTPLQYIPFANRIEASNKLPNKYLFVCISERLKVTCLKNNILEDNLWCRPNPVDENRFRTVENTDKISLRKKLTRFNENDIVISCIAKYIPRKNHKILIEAMKYLPEQYKLFLAGPIVDSGPLKDRDSTVFNDLVRNIFDNGLDKRVQISNGFIDKIEEYYQMSDVYAFPSLSEGLGTPMLESIACGTQVVANRISGITDIWIKDGMNGYISSNNATDIADKIMSACKIPRKEMLNESKKLLSKASTLVLDAKYMENIKSLTTK